MWAKHASFCLSENKVSSTQLFWYFSLEIKSTYYMYLELTRWNILTLSVGNMAYSDTLIIRWLRGKVIIAYLFTNRIVDRSTANIWTKPVFFFICKKKILFRIFHHYWMNYGIDNYKSLCKTCRRTTSSNENEYIMVVFMIVFFLCILGDFCYVTCWQIGQISELLSIIVEF